MPELPEVEHLRRTLEPLLLGRRIAGAVVRRPDYVRHARDAKDLLAGDVVSALRRKGKHLAIIADSGRSLAVHLGMSGQIVVRSPDHPPAAHTHVLWRLAPDHRPAALLTFDDPRRFGGVWTFPTFDALVEERWAPLGPDALDLAPRDLRAALAGSRRAIKAALLDQAVVAGVGNIYADEALFLAGVKPQRSAAALASPRSPAATLHRLCDAIRRVLAAGIDAGGSSLRNYVDALGRPGAHQLGHLVYGRSAQPCVTCAAPLRSGTVAQRTTTWCPRCQR